MIKAELNYNPYLLETRIQFNGQEPRINSLVEKFQEGSLQRWVKRIPEIFHDEMNGYDFELEFSGTELDYLEVVDAFRKKGVPEESVRIFHKNELDERKKKTELIDQLMEWLSENRNRTFDFEKFKSDNADLLGRSYSYIIFQGDQLHTDTEDPETSVEHVHSPEELSDTDLRNTPVLLYISEENAGSFQMNLRYFLSRNDVEADQLFFLIDPALDGGKVERIIQDLGIQEPQIVADVFDDSIKKYIELFPVSEYLYTVIAQFKTMTEELSAQLQVQSRQCAIANREIYLRIEQYEENLRRLKEAHLQFVNRDNIEIPSDWYTLEAQLLSAVRNWKKRKTKITDDAEAYKMAGSLEFDVKAYFDMFLKDLENSAKSVKQEIDTLHNSWYRNAQFDTEYQITGAAFNYPEFSNDLALADDLLKLFEEEYVQPKEDRIGRFFKPSSNIAMTLVPQKTYYYQNWRQHAEDVIRPKETGVVSAVFFSLKKYEREIADSYIQHLNKLIEAQNRLKDQEAAKLSDEERRLQDDADWLVKVKDQLEVIERG